MARLVIFGAGDIARLAHVYFTDDSPHDVVGFAVDSEYRRGDAFQGQPLVDFEALVERFPPDGHRVFVALSYARMNQARADACARVKQLGYDLASYVSSRCTYLAQEPPGENCFILEDNTVQPFVRIGDDVTLWSGNHVGHDSTVEDHCFVTSHVVISGNCRVGAYSFLGVNATLHNSVKLGARTLVAAGAIVAKDTVEGAVLVPARSLTLERTSDQIDL